MDEKELFPVQSSEALATIFLSYHQYLIFKIIFHGCSRCWAPRCSSQFMFSASACLPSHRFSMMILLIMMIMYNVLIWRYCDDGNDDGDDDDNDTQAVALMLANTTNTIDSVVDKINSQIHLDIKDHRTVMVFSVIRCDHFHTELFFPPTSATCFLLSLLHLKLRGQMRRRRREGAGASFDIPTAPPYEARTDLWRMWD